MNAAATGGFVIKDEAGLPYDTVNMKYRGRLVNLDGGHPGTYAHLAFASDLLEQMRGVANAKADGKFGGQHWTEFKRAKATLLDSAKLVDEAIRGAIQNP